MGTTSPGLTGRPGPERDAAAGLLAGLPAAGITAGLIGRAIGQSRTPGMHEAEGRRLGLDYRYHLFDFDRMGLPDAALPQVLRAAAERGLAGVNVTHPFKQAVIRHLDWLAPDAAAIGAVNTVVFRDGRAEGHNTDCSGFGESLARELPGAPLERVLLLGAGGAGAAVARALAERGAGRIVVYDLDQARASDLVERIQGWGGTAAARPAGDLRAAITAAQGLVNCTPIGMDKYPGSPAPLDALRSDLWVADVIYFPEETALVRAARARCCRVQPGRGMAIFQAVRAFELFTGRTPDPDAVSAHFDALAPGRVDLN